MHFGLYGEDLHVLLWIVDTWPRGHKPQSSCCKTSDSAVVKYNKLELNLHVSKQQILQKQASICWSPARRPLGYDIKAHKPRSSCA